MNNWGLKTNSSIPIDNSDNEQPFKNIAKPLLVTRKDSKGLVIWGSRWGGCPSPPDPLNQTIKSVDGFIFFRLSYFDKPSPHPPAFQEKKVTGVFITPSLLNPPFPPHSSAKDRIINHDCNTSCDMWTDPVWFFTRWNFRFVFHLWLRAVCLIFSTLCSSTNEASIPPFSALN